MNMNRLHLQLLLLFLNLYTRPVISWWLYTWPQGKCASFTSCQDCVVEFAYDKYNIRRPCTWCPGKSGCEMMNHYTGRCSEGATYRTTCPIRAENMPSCVYFQYSFWVNLSSSPQNRNQCHETYANDFAKKRTNNKVVKMCNGDKKNLEPLTSGWGTVSGLVLGKNPYGLDVNLNYDVWFNPDYGEDRRRIETEVTSVDDTSFKWLCNAAHQGNVNQALIMKYRVTEEDPTPTVVSDGIRGAATSSTSGAGLALFVAAAAMMWA